MTSEQPVVTLLYRVDSDDQVVSVAATLKGEQWWYRDPHSDLPVHRDAVDSHYWFSTPGSAIRHKAGKLRNSRRVFVEAQQSAQERVEQIDASIAKLEAQL